MPYLFTNELERSTSTPKPCAIVQRDADHESTILVNQSPSPETKTMANEPNKDEKPTSKYPIVKLETDIITDATAARLATSLLGHILFLKNQVPFPVIQLSRLPGTKTNTRATKQRTELLTSFDTISSHFDTTFTALSTAFARCSSASISASPPPQAHLAFLVGPSLTLAKAKIILGVDGLEVRVWGSKFGDLKNGDEDEDAEDGSGDEVSADGGCDSGDEEYPEDSDEEDDDDDDEGGEEEETSDEEVEDERNGTEEQENERHEDENEDTKSIANRDGRIFVPKPTTPYRSYAEEQRFLQTADRLLSRTLAAADADGHGILSEMSPTQTHVLLHAPRRFSHPAWIPRQNVASSLDSALQEFMTNSGLEDAETMPASKPLKKSMVEGVWITTRSGLSSAIASLPEKDHPKPRTTEDDEMIWWSWDGKFVGFADW